MKPDIMFLRTLRKELRFLKEDEKEKFISEYRLKIDDRYQRGEEFKEIVDSFEAPNTIAKKIYQEYPFDTENIEKNSKTDVSIMIWLGSFFSTIPQLALFISSIAFILAGVIVGIGTIFIFALCWLNFDPLQAIGPALLTLGIFPLLSIAIIWIGQQLFKLESLIFKSIWRSLTAREIQPKLPQIGKQKAKKIFKIIFITFCSLVTVGGTIGSFAGEKTIGYTSIKAAKNGSFFHNQTETLKISEFVTTEPIKISYKSLTHISWYGFTFIEDKTIGSNIEINRDYNTKENLKLKFSIKKQDDSLSLNADMPWHLWALNLSSNKFTIKYDPTLVQFTAAK